MKINTITVSEQSLILIHHDALEALATEAARQLIDDALALGALIGQVRTPEDNDEAVKAQVALKGVMKQIDDAHRAAKDPLVKLGRKLDQLKAGLLADLDREYGRIGQLAAEFALAERRRVVAEALLAKDAMDKLEAEKYQALAQTSDPVAQSAVLEDFSRRQAEAPAPSAPSRAAGQKVREEWEIKVVDIIALAKWALAQGRWDVLDFAPRKGRIKELLEGGMTGIPGLECKKVAKATVNLPRGQKEIEV